MLSYRPLPGHGHTNAAALHQAGGAMWARHRADLAEALTATPPPAQVGAHTGIASVISELTGVSTARAPSRLDPVPT